ncbi:MAG: DUF1499 domain-containing protein [Gemmatimonadetes bacterium]|nr:DUF1499 domain-containing protein [Gemmatimonadota bacterium]
MNGLTRPRLGWRLAVLALLAACHGKPGVLAVPGGPLPPCPSSPNCVSTEATDEGHRMAAVSFTGDATAAQAAARAALLAEPRTRVVLEQPGYLRAEATSRLFRFVDDVEIVVDTANRVYRFRSASRLGKGDMGVNRARMTRIAARLGAP